MGSGVLHTSLQSRIPGLLTDPGGARAPFLEAEKDRHIAPPRGSNCQIGCNNRLIFFPDIFKVLAHGVSGFTMAF